MCIRRQVCGVCKRCSKYAYTAFGNEYIFVYVNPDCSGEAQHQTQQVPCNTCWLDLLTCNVGTPMRKIYIATKYDEQSTLCSEYITRNNIYILPYITPLIYTHLRAHETPEHLVCR